MSRNRRRAFTATSSLQYRFLAMILVYGFIIVCFFAVAVFASDLVVIQDQSLSLQIRGFAASRMLEKQVWVWPAVFSLVLLLGVHSFLAFQKIMGPLYRFRRAFEALEKGDLLYSVKIRKKDYLHTEEQALESMIKALSGKLEAIKNTAEEALGSVGQLEETANVGTEWSDDQMDLLRAQRERLENLAAAFQCFRLSGEGDRQPASAPML
jgi:methyl-accepting chemotaxis protein